MKVVYPITRFGYTSQDGLPASCTSKPQVPCTSAQNIHIDEGYSNQEIYAGIVKLKNHFHSLFSGQKQNDKSLNYVV